MKAVISFPDGTTITLSSRRSSTKSRRKAKAPTRSTRRSSTRGQRVTQLTLPW